MVGRPGRSRGCVTCRRRKIKCDEGRPTCQKCRSSGFECEGYTNLTFISYGTGDQHRAPPASSGLQQPRTLVFVTENIADFNRALSEDPSSPSSISDSDDEDTRIIRGPYPSPYDANMLLSHMNAVFSKFRGLPSGIVWPGLSAAHHQDWNSWTCVLALASAIFGRSHRVPGVVAHGTSLYGASLRKLNKQLASRPNPARRGSRQTLGAYLDDDALLSAMILGAYELFTSTSIVGWASHYRGLGEMMRLRGPEAHISALPLRVFQANRFLILVAAMADRKPTFLSQPEWKTLPWKASPKDEAQKLCDHVADISGLMHDADALVLGDLDAQNLLYERAMDVLDGLLAWRAARDADPAHHMTTVPNASADPEQVALFPEVHVFSRLEDANCMCIYNGACIEVYEILLQVAPEMLHNDDDFPDDLVGTALYTVGSKSAALEICRSIPYQLASEQGLAGPLFVLWPLRQAWKALGGQGPECQWLESILRGMSGSNGWGVGRSALMLTKGPNSMFRA